MDLDELQRNWDDFGRIDPLWAILTDPARSGQRWTCEEFYRTGEHAIAELIEQIDRARIPLRRERCLDFGCGVGRLTQALCTYFAECHGVDIAPSMIDLARKLNRFADRCHYHVNASDDLGLFPDAHFDLVTSFIVLQHMRPEYGKRYLREFVRVLAPGGVAVFQVPGERREIEAASFDLPASAYRAQIAPRESFATLAAGETWRLHVKVENRSDAT